jgi:scyllo-inositol 2-dehydrogenase (NADP+)
MYVLCLKLLATLNIMKQITVGIIGFGLSGRYFFAPFFTAHPGFTLKGFVSSQSEAVFGDYPEVSVYPSVSSLLDDPELDLVVVSSPNFTHFEYAKAALLAHKHVIVEKPFTVTVAEADALLSLSKAQNRLLIPFQNRRWDGDLLTIKKLIEEDTLGEILEFESHFDRYRPDKERVDWKNDANPGVGNLYDLGPHLIDQALYLFGKPDWVWGDIRKQRPHGNNTDYFEIQLHYPVTKVVLKAGVMCREIGPRFVVHGRKGSFVKYGLDVQEQNLKDGIQPGNALLGMDKEENFGLLHTETDGEVARKYIVTEDGNYMLYFENVYRSIIGEEELIVRPEDGLMTVEVIEKALLASNEKRMVSL